MTIKVQTLFLRHFIAPRNSEYQDFPMLRKLEPKISVEFRVLDSLLPTLYGNAIYGLSSLLQRHRLTRGIAHSRALRTLFRSTYVSEAYLRRSRSDLILTRHAIPINPVSLPIIFEMDFFVFGIDPLQDEVRRLLYVPDFLLKRCTMVSVRHPLSLQAFRRQFPNHAGKAFLVPHYLPFLEPAAVNDVVRKFESSEEQPRRILFVGNLSRLKGLPELLEAYRAVKNGFGSVEFAVVSNFRDGRVPLPREVRVMSNLSRDEVYRLMEETHIFAMPSKREATGRVFWEAMAKGCAILGPDVSPQRELFGRYGMVADPRSPRSIAEGLAWMLRNPEECLRRALAGRQEFVESYSRSVVEARYLQLFQEAIRRGRAAQRD